MGREAETAVPRPVKDSTERVRPACARSGPSVRTRAGPRSTSIALVAASVRRASYRRDGGLAVLYGNLAPMSASSRRLVLDTTVLTFAGPARVYESQEAAVDGIQVGTSSRARSWSSATRDRRVAPACRRCCIPPPTSRAGDWGRRARSSPTDGSPEARPACRSACVSRGCEGGVIALEVRDGDRVLIDIPVAQSWLDVTTRFSSNGGERICTRFGGLDPARSPSDGVHALLARLPALTTSAARGAVPHDGNSFDLTVFGVQETANHRQKRWGVPAGHSSRCRVPPSWPSRR